MSVNDSSGKLSRDLTEPSQDKIVVKFTDAGPDLLPGKSGLEQSPPAHLWIALAVQAVMILCIVQLVGIRAWDDGAITLAYSRTFAETGRIALTSVSETVEGYSSTAWFLLNAMIGLFRPGFEGAIYASQVASGLFLGIATIFVWLIARSFGLRSQTTLAILLVFSLFGPSVSEVANGMEMTLLTASGLGLFYALYVRLNWLILLISIVLFLTTRFEAMIYYAGLLIPLLFRRRYRDFVMLAALGMMIVGLQEFARYVTFGDIVPNPIYAKTHAPYSLSGLQGVQLRLIAAVEVTAVLFPLILAMLIYLILIWNELTGRARTLMDIRSELWTMAIPLASVILFAILIGKNWGYVGRMQFLALPLALLIIGWFHDKWFNVHGQAVHRAVISAVCSFTIVFSWFVSAKQPISQMVRAFSSNDVEIAERNDVTPATYRRTGLAVDKLRQILGKDIIVFASPDVGGLALCCNQIRIMDIGLLASRSLAKRGYEALPSVLVDERPDLIEVHQHWASLSKIYSIPEFKHNYQPAIIDRIRYFLRTDHIETLVERNIGKWCREGDAECLTSALQTHRYVSSATRSDDVAFLVKGRFLMVNDLYTTLSPHVAPMAVRP